MKPLELLASDIALLSDRSLEELARILVRDYEPRADKLEHALAVESQDALREIETQLGV